MEENKEHKLGTKAKINWSSVVVFFLLGFMITMPAVIMKLVPSTGSRIIKVGNELLFLKDQDTLIHVKEQKNEPVLFDVITSPDTSGVTCERAEMSFSGNRIYVLKDNTIDVYRMNPRSGRFEFYKTLDAEKKK
mgnify:CR=1 FL=1